MEILVKSKEQKLREKHISEQILHHARHDPLVHLHTLEDAQARLRNNYVLHRASLKALLGGFEEMARAFRHYQALHMDVREFLRTSGYKVS